MPRSRGRGVVGRRGGSGLLVNDLLQLQTLLPRLLPILKGGRKEGVLLVQ
jgi:hypothetical protein